LSTTISSDNFRGTIFKFGAGFPRDHVIIPIPINNDAEVYTNGVKIDWVWKRPILFSEKTVLTINGNQAVGCIVFLLEKHGSSDGKEL
jgi:hypothetical protein